ncbi:hypothetical protein HKX48_009589, partial [Thoreauomyces humboldtii]
MNTSELSEFELVFVSADNLYQLNIYSTGDVPKMHGQPAVYDPEKREEWKKQSDMYLHEWQ